MEILKFGLGIRFDVMAGEEEQATPKQLWEEVLSVLTASDVKGMHVYGGHAAYETADPCYTCVFTNGSLKEMRRVFKKLNEDAGVDMYLAPTHPFLQNNALEKIEGLMFFGKVQRDGSVVGGDARLEVQVCKKRGKRRPAGKGIVFLLAPDHYGAQLSSKRAIRRLTIAARKHFKGVRVLPLPVADGGPGTVDAVLTACSGIRRTVQIKGPDGAPVEAHYAVIKGKTAIIELPEAFAAAGRGGGYHSSFGIGELIRRALDEGLSSVVLGCVDSNIDDFGLGCMRALGMKLLDEAGEEIESGADELARLYAIDTEFLHARIAETHFMLMTDMLEDMRPGAFSPEPLSLAYAGGMDGFERYCKLLEAHAHNDAAKRPGAIAGRGLGLSLMGVCGAKGVGSIQALLYGTEMMERIRYVSLVVSGEEMVDESSLEPNRIVGALAQLCGQHRIPLALLAGSMGSGAEEVLERCNCSIFTAPGGAMQEAGRDNAVRVYDDSANRMFSFIRLGREIERVSARKSW